MAEAEALIYERLRVREMMGIDDDFTFLINTSDTALPADFLDPLSFRPYTWVDPLPYVHEDSLYAYRDANGELQSGTPCRWTIMGVRAYVDVSCLAAFPGVLSYYARPAALAATTNETNFLTVRYPSLLRYACMVKAYEHMKDSARIKDNMALFLGALGDAGQTNDMFRRAQYVPA